MLTGIASAVLINWASIVAVFAITNAHYALVGIEKPSLRYGLQ